MGKLPEDYANLLLKDIIRIEFVEGHIEITTDSQKILLSMPKIMGIDSMGQ